MPAEPVGQLVLAQLAGGQGDYTIGRVDRFEPRLAAVEGDKCVRHRPGGAFVAAYIRTEARQNPLGRTAPTELPIFVI